MFSKDFKPCENCAAKKGHKPGFYYIDLPNHTTGIVECSCHKAWVAREKQIISIRKSNIGDFDLSYDPLTCYKGKCSRSNMVKFVEYIDQLDDAKFMGMSAYIYGPNGTQKTHLSKWAVAHTILKGRTAYYITMNEMINILKSSFETDLLYEDMLKLRSIIDTVDLLVIDECFDKQKVTLYQSGFQIPFIDENLRRRLNKGKKIVFISNKPVNMIEAEGFGYSIQDLVSRNTSNIVLEMVDNYMKSDFKIDNTIWTKKDANRVPIDPRAKRITAYVGDKEYSFASVSEAASQLNSNRESIRLLLNGKSKSMTAIVDGKQVKITRIEVAE